MPQIDRTLQDTLTSMPPADVIAAAKQFFARYNSIYTAFVDMEGPDFVSMRGAGNEEVIIAATPRDGATFVTGSTYYYDQQLARFLASLPAPDGYGVALLAEELPQSATGNPATAPGAQA
jgi:hypothetical protein